MVKNHPWDKTLKPGSCTVLLGFERGGEAEMMSATTLSLAGTPDAPSIEASTIATIHRRIIPYLLVLYAVAYLDRTNISYAALTMNPELGMSDRQFGFSASIFFLGYFFFEVPSNIALSRFGARRWIGGIMISWGIVAVITGFVQNVTHLYILRFLLGATEAGFFPGVAFYLTCWFPRRHRAKAMATFLLAQIACNVLGAPISGFVMDHVTWFSLYGWRWTIILEGLPAVLLGLCTQKYLDDDPGKTDWLSAEQKTWLARELAAESQASLENDMAWWRYLSNPHVLYLAVTYVFIVMAIYGATFWTPIIIKGLEESLSNTTIGLLLVIPTLIGGVAMWINGWHSDKTMERRWHVVGVVLIGAIGFFLLAVTTDVWLSIVWFCLISVAAYGYVGVWWTIPTSFLSGSSAAVGLAAINSVGNLGGFFGPNVVGMLVSSTGNQKAGLVFLGISFVIGAVMLALFRPPRLGILDRVAR
jgi:MFS transporter, ACS family, tartrate transporter